MNTCWWARPALLAALLAGVSGALADDNAAARFHGAPTYDLAVTNVKWEACTPDYSFVTFDLSWSGSWRAKWTEPAANNVTGKPLELENWDAAWVFVKFLPEKDSKESKERNHWQHATLASNAADHAMPAGATNTVGLTDTPVGSGASGKRGLGVFIYRDVLGQGANHFKGVKLRWMHPPAPKGEGTKKLGSSGAASPAKFDPAKAALKVHTIAMIYVPEGAFKVGSGAPTRIAPFADGETMPILQAGTWNEMGGFTDGSWRGGPVVPFLVDQEWSRPAAAGPNARRIGAVPGQLWGTVGYWEHVQREWNHPYANTIGASGALNDEYPTGYEAFYCMKYQLTQGQYADFLNSLPREIAAARATAPETNEAAGPGKNRPWEKAGLTITVSSQKKASAEAKPPPKPVPDPAADAELDELLGVKPEAREAKAEVKVESAVTGGSPPVYTARVPQRTCNFVSWEDGYAYAVWARLRPMTELEFEKVCRGPLNPVPLEHVWGTTSMVAGSDLRDECLPTERYATGNCSFLSRTAVWYGPSDWPVTRVGVFATPTSDRVAAGASYWGAMDMDIGAYVVPVGSAAGRAFRGSHGAGNAPVSGGFAEDSATGHFRSCLLRQLWYLKSLATDSAIPLDWPVPGGRTGLNVSQRTSANYPWTRWGLRWPGDVGRSSFSCWRGVRSVAPRTLSPPGPRPSASDAATPRPAADTPPAPVVEPARGDTVKIANLRCEPGAKGRSFVTFDLAWDDSWRAKWTEPADKNVTGKPLTVESWDAAWVFVKFRPKDAKAFSPASLSPADADHVMPAGASVSVGTSEDDRHGVGVFIHRNAVGRGANAFKNVKLCWLSGVDRVPDKAFDKDVKLCAHAIETVCVREGPFKTKSVWGHPLTLISTDKTTQPGGYYAGADTLPFLGFGDNATEARLKAGTSPRADVWPNGYRAFYCLKYSISQGQYAEFLNSVGTNVAAAHYPNRYTLNGFTIRRDAGKGAYVAEAPGRHCNFLVWSDILSFSAWAGLRPPTDMEYEKACRGPREVANSEAAWGEKICGPGTGLGSFKGPSASYWGIRDLSLRGIVFELPGVVGNQYSFYDFTAYAGEGMFYHSRGFFGTHGQGTPTLPADWPEWSCFGHTYNNAFGWGSYLGTWAIPSEVDRLAAAWDGVTLDRTGRFGAHAVRTVSAMGDPGSPLQVDRLPNLRGCHVGLFYLTGRYRNDSDKPVKIEMASSSTNVFFAGGAAARAFTAAPKTATPFRVLTLLTRGPLMVGSYRTLPLRAQVPGGALLAEQAVPVSMTDPADVKASVISTIDGGVVDLRVANFTERAQALAIELPSPEIKMSSAPVQRIEVAAGAQGRAAFEFPRRSFAADRWCRMPYRVTLADGLSAVPAQAGAPFAGEEAVALRILSRWWVSRKDKVGGSTPAAPDALGDGGIGNPGEGEDVGSDGNLAGIMIFGSARPPEGWKTVIYGASIEFGGSAPLPSLGSSVTAATRVTAPTDRDATIRVGQQLPGKDPPRFAIRIWLNDRPVKDGNSVRLRAGGNTMLVECALDQVAPAVPGNIFVTFHNPKDEKQLTDMVLDIDRR